jgi:hypothetical protein
LKVRIVAVEAADSLAPLEAILVDLKRPHLGLMLWWGGYAWETLERGVTLENVLDDPTYRRHEMEVPDDWEEGYLRADRGVVEFIYGTPPSRTGERR